MERDKEFNQIKQAEDDDRWKQTLIQQEKERILREHLPYIDGFMPKSIIQSKDDAKYFTNTQQFNNQTSSAGFINRNKRQTKLW